MTERGERGYMHYEPLSPLEKRFMLTPPSYRPSPLIKVELKMGTKGC
jgi:hypothetical protein